MNYVEHLLILASTFTYFVSVSAFASAVGIPEGNTSSAVELKICVIMVSVKKDKSMIKKRRKKHNQIVFLARTTSYFLRL